MTISSSITEVVIYFQLGSYLLVNLHTYCYFKLFLGHIAVKALNFRVEIDDQTLT